MEHGTVGGYVSRGCRCGECQDAVRAARAARLGRPVDRGCWVVPGERVRPRAVVAGAPSLTDDEVRLIRARMSVEPRPRGTATTLARQYGVCRDTIYAVANGQTYAHVE